ncbi:5973_t:CDS:2 [Funneliformis caledonium]|uniref:5973_t:CDS:1 n=1 Tax=Funneliformis caledonium TaxID=1117310 RepID=A0A9N9DX31_9GLOM|nr:5973_t:CDS:2 [Funneliformis caledonium]
MGCDPITIRRIIDRYKKTEKTENLLRSEHPLALNNNETNTLINKITQDRCEPLHEVINTLGLNCNLTTAKRVLYDIGIYFHVAAKKTFYIKKSCKVFLRTVGELKVALSEKWKNLDYFIFEEIVALIPQRINAILEARGGSTHY